jgi:hypothetical protein
MNTRHESFDPGNPLEVLDNLSAQQPRRLIAE